MSLLESVRRQKECVANLADTVEEVRSIADLLLACAIRRKACLCGAGKGASGGHRRSRFQQMVAYGVIKRVVGCINDIV